MCYSDLPYLYTGRGLVELDWPYSDDPQVRDRYEVMEYPVGIAYFAYGAAWVTQKAAPDCTPTLRPARRESQGQLYADRQVKKETLRFVIVNALGFAAMALLSAWLLAGVNPRRPWDAAAFAASPALLLTGLINWDMLAVVMVAGALFTWARGRPVADRGAGRARHGHQALPALPARRRSRSSACASGATATWSTPCSRRPRRGSCSTRRRTSAARTSGSGSGTFNSERGPDLGSVWLVLSQMTARHRSARPRSTTGPWALFGALVRGGRGGRVPGAEHAAAGAARLPRGRRLPAGQQGLLAAVRALAAAAGRAGPAALARPAGLAGRARSSTSRRCGGTSTATSRPARARTSASTGSRS